MSHPILPMYHRHLFSLHKCLPPDIHTRASGRMHITVTEVRERFCILTSNVAFSPEQWLTLHF